MKAYELLFFVNPSLDVETRAAVMKRIDVTTTLTSGASASSPTRSTISPKVTTPSSTSMQIPRRSPSSIAFSALPMRWSAT